MLLKIYVFVYRMFILLIEVKMDILSNISLVIAASIPLVAALTVHEVAKAWTAKKLGDRYTLKSYNPIDYIDPLGTLAIPLMFILPA